jgi:RNA polymerase sigma-70 factor, ECF subfamily
MSPGQARESRTPDDGGAGATDLSGVASRAASQAQFEQLYGLYFEFTWRVLRHLGVPAASLDDAVQEVWLVVYQRLGGFEGRSTLKTWLFGITLNVARNTRRAEDKRVRQRLTADELRDPPPDPEMEHLGREAWQRVQQFLSTLDEERRAIFVCSLLEHLPAQQTAEATGVDVTTVYQRVRTLRQAFKQWLEASSAEPEILP